MHCANEALSTRRLDSDKQMQIEFHGQYRHTRALSLSSFASVMSVCRVHMRVKFG